MCLRVKLNGRVLILLMLASPASSRYIVFSSDVSVGTIILRLAEISKAASVAQEAPTR